VARACKERTGINLCRINEFTVQSVIFLKEAILATPVLSDDPYATQTAPVLKKDHPFRYIQGFRRKTHRPLI